MAKSAKCCGWTPSEMRMWFSFTALVASLMLIFRVSGGMDWFRIFFFGSPALVTIILGPLQRDKRLYKLLGFSAAAFTIFWLIMQSYPAQCRHAWGTRMVSDTTFWGNEEAQKQAILLEKDNFYVLKDVTDKESHDIFVGGRLDSNSTPAPAPKREGESMDAVWEILKSGPEKHMSADPNAPSPRVKKWIAPITAGGSLDILRLRAYCNLHILDETMPHVYPLRVLGLETDWAAPCPYWSCVLTEAHAGGKQIFWIAVALSAFVQFLHYRADCGFFQWWFGTGTVRVFWSWFWATLLPFLTVLLIKTTADEEIATLVWLRFKETQKALTEWFGDTRHDIYFGVFCVSMLVVYIYWEKVRDVLGLPQNPLANCFLHRSVVQEQADERTFQVCVWRIDMQNAVADAGSPRGPGSDDSDGADYSSRTGSRSLLFGGGRGSPTGWMRGGGLSLWGREEDQDTLRTHDGRRPTIVVRFFYGQKEIQRTRAVRPTQSEWNNKAPVYVQENFRCSVAFRPGTPLRVEVQDIGAPLGTVSIGDLVFDEHKLKRQFEDSRASRRDASQAAVHQVIKMLENAGGREPQKEAAAVQELRQHGFVSHALSDGGAIWLAFCETDLAQQAESNFGCCGGA